MSNPGVNHEINAPLSLDELDLALADLDLGEDSGETVVIEEIEETQEITADDERAIEALNVKSEVYEAVEPTEITENPGKKPRKARAGEKAAKAPKEPKAASEKKPKIERDLNALPADLFQLSTALENDAATVIALRPPQKKIAEKFDNVFQALAAGRAPSVYVMDCFNALDAAPGKSLTSKELIGILTSTRTSKRTYSQGTASSQVGQIMVLFPVLGVAGRTGNALSLNEFSKIAERLRAL